MSAFGKNIYSLRKERGWTQAELADRLGVTNQAVSKWETGESLPDSSLLLPLSELFDVTIDELFKGKRAESEEDNEFRNDARNEAREERTRDDDFTGKDDDDEEDENEPKLTNDRPQEWRSKFAVLICTGLCLIFAGVIEIVLVGILMESFAVYGVMIMFEFFAVGVPIIVYAGIKDAMYYLSVKSDEWKPSIARFAKGISFGVALCILAVMGFVFGGATEEGSENVTLILCIGMVTGFVLIAAAVTVFIVSGMRFGAMVKRLAPEYTRERNEEHGVGRFGGVVMLIATAIFLTLGLAFDKWHPAWVVFPVGGIICAILGSIDEATGKKCEHRHKRKP